tara:strand:+ start:71 stop:2176 length:2106 start_codon:yes stop_codon:yes gene_type:complete
MPKIPTFTSTARPTAEAAGVVSNIKVNVNQSVAAALRPLGKAAEDYYIKEKTIENKTEALELENKSVLELNDVAQKASSLYKNSEQANSYLMQQSKIIRDKYASQASSGTVKTMFTNSYLLEEQKKIFSVDNAVYKNLVQSRAIESNTKEERILTDSIYGNNELAKAALPTDLSKIYLDDYNDGLIDIDTYEGKVAAIPNTIGYFQVQKDITNDPVQTYVNLNTGKYEGLTLKTREELKRDAKLEATPILRENITNYLVGLENGIKVNINEPAIKEIFGNKVYQDFKETQANTIRVSVFKSEIFNSKIGNEQKILDGFELNSGNLAQDLEYKQKVKEFISQKSELIKNDAAVLILTHNKLVRNNFDIYNAESDPTIKSQLFTKYINSVVQAQKDMDIDSAFIKVLPQSFAKNVVQDYNKQEPLAKVSYLQSLETQYGEQYGRVLNQLTENGLPVTAKLVSYLNDENFATMATSIDTKEERTRLDNYIKTTDQTFSTINKEIAEEMEDFRKVVMFSNKMNTTKANEELGDIQKVITYIAINSMSAGMDQSKAVKKATDYINNNFVFAGGSFGSDDTYFIPRNYDNKRLSPKHIEFIEKKSKIIKRDYLQDFNIKTFESTNEKISNTDLNEEMLEQAKDNGVWINNADGSGIVFAIEFADGSLGLIENEKGELLQINFDDDSYKLPGTDTVIDMGQSTEEEPI